MARGHIEPVIFGGNRANQRSLNAFSGLQIPFEPSFIAGNLFIEASVFQRDSEIGSEDGKGLNVFLVKGVELGAFQIKHTNNSAFVEHGNGKLGTGFRVDHEIARVDGNVRSEDGVGQSGGCASASGTGGA